MSEVTAPVTTDTATIIETPATIETPSVVVAPVIPQGLSDAPTSLDFIPEAYRQDPSFAKYKSQDEFFKGFQNLQKLVGQKQVVEGLKVPGDNATPEELNDFYLKLGRPESMDKYALPEDVKFHEGIDTEAEKKTISEIAFELGLSNKQAAGLMKKYAEKTNESFIKEEARIKETFDQAVVSAFGNDFQSGLGLAKKGAKSLGYAATLDEQGLSSNPVVLKILSELGKHVGEDSFENGSSESAESLLDEALKIQKSADYLAGDKVARRKVREIYQKVYPEKSV